MDLESSRTDMNAFNSALSSLISLDSRINASKFSIRTTNKLPMSRNKSNLSEIVVLANFLDS